MTNETVKKLIDAVGIVEARTLKTQFNGIASVPAWETQVNDVWNATTECAIQTAIENNIIDIAHSLGFRFLFGIRRRRWTCDVKPVSDSLGDSQKYLITIHTYNLLAVSEKKSEIQRKVSGIVRELLKRLRIPYNVDIIVAE